MGRPGVSYHDVVQAAQSLFNGGVSPTIEGIRGILKSGSYSTIAPLLRRWKEEHDHGEILVQEGKIPGELIVMIKNLWDQLNAKANEKIVSAENHLKSEIEVLQQRLKNDRDNNEKLLKSHNILKQEREKTLNDNLVLSQCIDKITKDRDILTEIISAKDQQMEEKQIRIDELHRLHQQSQDNLEHYREASREQRALDLHLAEQTKTKLEQEIVSLQKNINSFILDNNILLNKCEQLDAENNTLKCNNITLIDESKKMRSNFLDMEKLFDASELESNNLQNQKIIMTDKFEQQIAKNISLEKELSKLQEQLDQLSKRAKMQEDQNKLLAQDKWELAQEKFQLLGQLKQLQAHAA